MRTTASEPLEINLVTDRDELRVPFHKLAMGSRFLTRGRTITEADVVQFAALTASWQPVHTDDVYAKNSIFGQRVAHSGLLVSYALGLALNEYAVGLRRLRDVVFKRPVFLGDTIRVDGVVIDLRWVSEDTGLVTGQWRIYNQSDQTVVKLCVEALWANKEL
jgi:3-hydroxybutyryl-CoA dehydratase